MNNYKKIWGYLKKNKIYFLIILVLFIISILIGFLFPVFFVEFIKKFILELADKTKNMNFFQLLIFILENNLTTAFFGMLLGVFFGIFPLLLVIFNGYVLGFVSNKTVGLLGFNVLFKLIPHGIFELPALVLSLGLGLKLGMFIFSKNKKKYLYENFENSLRIFIYVILPLLIIAGIIETGLIFVLG